MIFYILKINKEMNKNMKIFDICKNAKVCIYYSINCKFMWHYYICNNEIWDKV